MRTSKGVWEEITAAAELTLRGYDVFAPIAGFYAGCDLIALCPKSGEAIRVEVKRCVFKIDRANGNGVSYSNGPPKKQRGKHDVVAFVMSKGGGNVIFEPEGVIAPRDVS
jgi:hypothetical protein